MGPSRTIPTPSPPATLQDRILAHLHRERRTETLRALADTMGASLAAVRGVLHSLIKNYDVRTWKEGKVVLYAAMEPSARDVLRQLDTLEDRDADFCSTFTDQSPGRAQATLDHLVALGYATKHAAKTGPKYRAVPVTFHE